MESTNENATVTPDLALASVRWPNPQRLPDNATLVNVLVTTSRLKRALHHGATATLRSAGLTMSQWLILCYLQRAASGTLSQIAVATGHDAGALSRAAHLLQQRRLITATKTPGNRRSVRLSLTQPGRALHELLDAHTSQRLDKALEAAMGPPAFQGMLQLMEQAAASLDTAQEHI
ncbi:MarR family transcriptional regulator [Cupriavidus oxalaticus]|uniref:MarR family transcriptional regulator n=1 Tax=Cupriavidus oxalaticus TaxID=96344 RepID=UPI0031731F48